MNHKKNLIKSFDRIDVFRSLLNRLAKRRIVRIRYNPDIYGNTNEGDLIEVKKTITKSEMSDVRIVYIHKHT